MYLFMLRLDQSLLEVTEVFVLDNALILPPYIEHYTGELWSKRNSALEGLEFRELINTCFFVIFFFFGTSMASDIIITG